MSKETNERGGGGGGGLYTVVFTRWERSCERVGIEYCCFYKMV